MSKLIGEYTVTVTGLMQTIAREEEAAILKAADLLSDKVVEGPADQHFRRRRTFRDRRDGNLLAGRRSGPSQCHVPGRNEHRFRRTDHR